MRTRTYLDHAATTPLRPEALAAFSAAAQQWGNPASLHSSGRAAKLRVEDARDRLAATLGAHPTEVIFTAGGTEADNLALKGLFWARHAEDPRRVRIILTGIEHPAILDTAEWLAATENAQLEWIPVDPQGRVDLSAWRAAIVHEPQTIALATLMWANNEVGTIQPIDEAGQVCREYGIPFHVDAVQAFGAVPIDFAATAATTMAVSGHKLGAPVGIGALLVSREAKLTPVLHGGGQERDIRSGTTMTALITAFAAAAEAATADLPATMKATATLRDALITGIQQRIPAAQLQGAQDVDPESSQPLPPGTHRLPGNVNFTFPGCEGDSLLFGLDMAGVESSTGSACTAGVTRPSHVLLALGADEDTARSTQRFTFGHTSGPADVDHVLEALPAAYDAAKQAGMAGQDSSIRTANSHRKDTA